MNSFLLVDLNFSVSKFADCLVTIQQIQLTAKLVIFFATLGCYVSAFIKLH